VTSNERNYIDGLWRALKIDPRDERAQLLELHVIRASVRELGAGLEDVRAVYTPEGRAARTIPASLFRP
jgi:hypothetical protein